MTLVFEGKTLQHVERQAMKGTDPNYGTRGKRRNLIRLAIQSGKVCAHCNKPVFFIWEKDTNPKYNKRRMATFDHIILAKNGGTYKLENGLLACHECNGLRGDTEIDVFRKRIKNGVGKVLAARNERRHLRNLKRIAKAAEHEHSPERKLFIFKLGYLFFLIEKRDKYNYENLPSQNLRKERALQSTPYSAIQRRNSIRSTADVGSTIWRKQRNFSPMGSFGQFNTNPKSSMDDQYRVISPKQLEMVDD